MLPAYRKSDGSSPDQAEDVASQSGPQARLGEREEEITAVSLVSPGVLSALMEFRLRAAQERETVRPPLPDLTASEASHETPTIPPTPASGIRAIMHHDSPTLPPPGSGIAESAKAPVVRTLLPTEDVIEDWFEALTDAPAPDGTRPRRRTVKLTVPARRNDTLVMANRPVPSPPPAVRSVRREPIPFVPASFPVRKTSWPARALVFVVAASMVVGAGYGASRWLATHGGPHWSAR